MRAGACTVEQTLTSEAATILKHSLTLSRRRGHGQVTPLHVAATLLTSRVSLLRRACLKSHPHSTSHPLQCRALELCFNVALNRLPTTPPSLLHTHPSLSNALIAALKRAQAHQRRGCVEQQQQQPLIAIKVELEQLIISILDDPSVSRVMREAGFSSTCVKNNLEDLSASSPPPFYTSIATGLLNLSSSCVETFLPTQRKQNTSALYSLDSPGDGKEELRLVLEVLMRKRRKNAVIVGDSLSCAEGLVSQLMAKVERGDEVVPEELKSVQFIKFNISSLALRFMKRDDVEMKVAELKRKVKSVASVGGAIIYTGDIKWVDHEEPHLENYSPVNHIIAEIGRLVSDFSTYNCKVWLMGIANYQTYLRCQMKTPSLETLWALQAVAVPSGGLGLSLHAPSGLDSHHTSQLFETKPLNSKDDQDKLICCGECTSNYEKEAGIFMSSHQRSSSLITFSDNKEVEKAPNSLPYWLQQHRSENHQKDILLELRRKWNRLCQSLHNPNRLSVSHSNKFSCIPSYAWWSTTLQPNQNARSNSLAFVESESKPSPNSSPAMFQFIHLNQPSNLSFDSPKQNENREGKITLTLGNSLFSDSMSSTDQTLGKVGTQDLCGVLLENLPWQSETLPLISEALLEQKLGTEKGTWLLIQGRDWIGKRRLALAIAESIFGSVDRLVNFNMKRGTEKMGPPSVKTFMEALRKEGSCVIFIEEVDYADADFMNLLAKGMEQGKFEDPIGREVCLGGFVIIITTKGLENEYKPNTLISMNLMLEESIEDLSAGNKRKAEWPDSPNKSKRRRTFEEGGSSSFNTLDLNVSAELELHESDSDVTEEAAADHKAPPKFLEEIKNSFVLDSNPAQLDRIHESLRSKMEAAASEIWSSEEMRDGVRIDGEVLEEVVKGSAYFLDSFFEKWLKDVFQTSLATVESGGKKGSVMRVCLGGREEMSSSNNNNIGDVVGFMGSCLPNKIKVCKILE